jgi:D-alanyl-D-alanine carboxypeptidase (penicillin-binding protein 5/6)
MHDIWIKEKNNKKMLAIVCVLCMIVSIIAYPNLGMAAETEEGIDFGLTARGAILMEASTGTVLYENNADEALSPASITKIMTLLLIFEALEDGKIQLDDPVTTSAYAKSMGGSQVFLEEGEVQTVETLIKCIVVASGNDASVAMAEYIAGSETAFVQKMNEKAKELGMSQTYFEDCCGLTDSPTHVTSARDVAVMSRELITRYPQVLDYSSIWMENITHVTAQGTSEFGLSSTNKLLKQFDGCNGLKTGSTSLAKYCVSATATRNGVTLIAVIMAAENYKVRFSEAASLLSYGFANCSLYTDEDPGELPILPVENGVQDTVTLEYGAPFSYLSMSGENFAAITKDWIYQEQLTAPIQAGDVLGRVEYSLDGKKLGEREILAAEDIAEAGYKDYIRKTWRTIVDRT